MTYDLPHRDAPETRLGLPVLGSRQIASSHSRQRCCFASRLLQWAAVGLVMLVLATLDLRPAQAAPGDLDTTFGTGGKVITDFGTNEGVTALVLQPEGKLVAAGYTVAATGAADFALARYNADGSLDQTFGTGGKVVTDLGDYISAFRLVLQSDGKLVTAGFGYSVTTGAADFALARYNADGSLDQTFGTGGKVGAVVGVPFGTALVLQPDGRLVAGGNLVLSRYNADGSLDVTFGTGGKISTVTTDFGLAVTALVLQPDGKLVAAGIGTLVTTGAVDFALARYNADGSVDSTFGAGGKVITDFDGFQEGVTALVLQPDGKLVAAGYSMALAGGLQSVLARYTPDGSLDPTFGTGGKVITDLSPVVTALVLQPDGKLVVGGGSVLARYTPDGSPDATFGTGGKVVTGFVDPYTLLSASLVIQPDGKLVVGGASTTGDFALARYQGDGIAPPQTGTLNVTTTPVNGDIFVDGALRGNGSISIQLPAGSYTVSFGAVGGYVTPSSQSVSITAGQTTSITGTYSPTGPTTVDLSVIVQRADNQAPIAGASVSISGPTPRSGVTDGSGLVLFSGITAGNYTVTASATGFSSKNEPVAAIGAPSIGPLQILLTPTGPVTGILNVATRPVNGDIFVNGVLYGTGSIRREVPVGSYTVSFGAVGGYTTPASQSVNITAGEERNIVARYDRIVLPKVNLLSPSNDATGVSITPTFVWSGVEGANLYWLMVAKDPSDFPTDPNATSCPSCVISGRTGLTSHTLPHTFPVEGRSGTLSVNTTYFWKVQAWNTNGARGDYSDTLRFTTGQPELTPPQRVETSADDAVASAPARKAVVITHGWMAKASIWVAEMAKAFCKKLDPNVSLKDSINENFATKVCQANHNDNDDDNDWDVWVYDWRKDAFTPLPETAFNLAPQHGDKLFDILKKENYQHIHFVAHSAGSNLIEITTRWLKNSVKRGERSVIMIHETFLDAYHPDKNREWYGPRADWADNYVDTRTVVSDDVDGTKLILKHAYNIDVTGDPDECEVWDDWPCRHSRPYRFYGLSITGMGDESFVGDADYKQSDPIDSTAGMGYLLSVEKNRTVDENDLQKHYPPEGGCKVLEGTCNEASPSPSIQRTLFAVNMEAEVENVTGTVQPEEGSGAYLYNSLTLGQAGVAVTSLAPQQMHTTSDSASPDATTEPPSYLVVNVTTASPVNTLRFNWSFHAAGEGLLRVFVGGNLVRQIDQRHVTPSSPETEEAYIGGAGEPLPAGTHRITFRLDGFGANPSGVELTDVELGLKAGPLTFPADTLPVGEQGVAYVYDLLAEGGMPPYTWSLLKGKLPGGLMLDAAGTIIGTPTKAKTKTFTVQVADAAGGSATQDLSLQIVKSVKLKTKKLPKGMVGVPYSATLQATGGISPLTFGLVSGALPPGFAPLDPAMGQISGIPTTAGTFDFVAQVTSSGGSSHQKNIRIKIK